MVFIRGHTVVKFEFERVDGTRFSRWYAYAEHEQPDHKAETLAELVELIG